MIFFVQIPSQRVVRRETRNPSLFTLLLFYSFTLSHAHLCPYPHRVVRLVPPSPSDILSRPLRPYARKQTTARGLQITIPSYIRPMAVKYPPQKKHR